MMKMGGLLNKDKDGDNMINPENIEDEYDFVFNSEGSSDEDKDVP